LTGEGKAAILANDDWPASRTPRRKKTEPSARGRGGVGYLVQVPLSTYGALGELHTEVTLLIHTHVREDALRCMVLSPRAKSIF